MLLHVSVCDHHQGARTWAYLQLQTLKHSVKYVVIQFNVNFKYVLVLSKTNKYVHQLVNINIYTYTSLELTAHCLIHLHTICFLYHLRYTICVTSLLVNIRDWSFWPLYILRNMVRCSEGTEWETNQLKFFVSVHKILNSYGNKESVILYLQFSCQQQYTLVCVHGVYFVHWLKGHCLLQQEFCFSQDCNGIR
jgi:hypothetical protein